MRTHFVGSSAPRRLKGTGQLDGVVNALVGADRSKWHRSIPTYGRVSADEIYPGVDVTYYGRSGRIEYDFVVAPGADPSQIKMRYPGSTSLRVDGNGDLVVSTGHQRVRQGAPLAFQSEGRSRRAVDAVYDVRDDGTVTIRVGSYDRSHPLVIDPTLTYSTYLGGASYDSGTAIAVDADGNAYVGGWTQSADFPTTNAVQGSDAPYDDAFVAKFNPAGTGLVYSTYIGGNDGDRTFGLALAPDGAPVITGTTASSDFPVTVSHKPCGQGSTVYTPWDAFAVKLAPSGSSFTYSTCFGGATFDRGNAVATDTAGAAYITGITDSTDFPVTATPIQAYKGAGGSNDAFLAKLSADGTVFSYSTYLGGGDVDEGNAIAVDGAGSAYVVGSTRSSDFPTANAIDSSHAAEGDAFLAKVAPSGSALQYSTFLGGHGEDVAHAVSVDSAWNAYVAGETTSTDFPVANPLQPFNAGASDGFVAKVEDGGGALTYSTYLGGSNDDWLYGIVSAPDGTANVVGDTTSSNFPTANALQSSHAGGGGDVAIAALARDGEGLNFATYLGGSADDGGLGIARDSTGAIYVTGWTWFGTFPTASAYDSTGNGQDDAFVLKLRAERLDDLAATFRPILRFDSTEPWRPLNVETFLAEESPTRPGFPYNPVCDASVCNTTLQAGTNALAGRPNGFVQVGADTPSGVGTDASDYISPVPGCRVNNLRDCDAGSSAGIYWHPYKSPQNTYIWLDYWAYYRFNDFRSGFDQHEGDWEGLVVGLSGPNATSFEVVGFAQHTGVSWFAPAALVCDGDVPCGSATINGTSVTYTNTGRRVHAFVANGSHASYPGPCTGAALTCRTLPEGSNDGTRRWGANDQTDALRRLPESPTSWTYWQGRWGSSCSPSFDCGEWGGAVCSIEPPCNSPRSPGRQTRFQCPSKGNPFVVDPCSFVTRRTRRAAGWQPRSASRCANWYSASVVAAACSPTVLSRAVRRGELSRGVTFAFVRPHIRRSGSVAGVSQVVGKPLKPGESLGLEGSLPPDTSIAIRLAESGTPSDAVFSRVSFRGGMAVIRATRSRHGTSATLRLPSGELIKPRILRRGKSATYGRLPRTQPR